MAGFGMINPRMGALAKKKAMAAKTASKAAAAPGGAQDQTSKVIKKAGRQPPGPNVSAGPAAKTSEKASGKTRAIGGNGPKGKAAALAAAKSAGLNVQKQTGFAAAPAKKGPVKGRNTGRGDSGGVM